MIQFYATVSLNPGEFVVSSHFDGRLGATIIVTNHGRIYTVEIV